MSRKQAPRGAGYTESEISTLRDLCKFASLRGIRVKHERCPNGLQQYIFRLPDGRQTDAMPCHSKRSALIFAGLALRYLL